MKLTKKQTNKLFDKIFRPNCFGDLERANRCLAEYFKLRRPRKPEKICPYLDRCLDDSLENAEKRRRLYAALRQTKERSV